MSKVVVGFSRPKKLKIGSLAIMAWMLAPYSHVYIKMYSPYLDRWVIYQASQGKVHCLTESVFTKHNIIYREFTVDSPRQCQRAFASRVYDLLGLPYGYLGLAKIVLAKLGVKLPGDGAKSFHCSELVALLLPDKFPGNPDFLEPVHIYRELVK